MHTHTQTYTHTHTKQLSKCCEAPFQHFHCTPTSRRMYQTAMTSGCIQGRTQNQAGRLPAAQGTTCAQTAAISAGAVAANTHMTHISVAASCQPVCICALVHSWSFKCATAQADVRRAAHSQLSTTVLLHYMPLLLWQTCSHVTYYAHRKSWPCANSNVLLSQHSPLPPTAAPKPKGVQSSSSSIGQPKQRTPQPTDM